MSDTPQGDQQEETPAPAEEGQDQQDESAGAGNAGNDDDAQGEDQ